MENRAHALAAGIFTLLMGLAAALAVWWLGQSRETANKYVLETRGNVSGLNLQAQVRYRGIRAGKVEAIEPDPKDPRLLLVRITMDSRFKLTRSASAQLGYQGVTGLAYVQIEDEGESKELLLTEGDDLPRIALTPTLFDSLGEKAGDIVAQVSDLSMRMTRVLDEKNLRNLSLTLENLAIASQGLREVPALMKAARETWSPENLRSLRSTLSHVEHATAQTAPLLTDMRDLVKTANGLTQRIDLFAASTSAEMSTVTLPRANDLLRELTLNSLQLSRLLGNLEDNPQMLLLGRQTPPPGPGEAGFMAPKGARK